MAYAVRRHQPRAPDGAATIERREARDQARVLFPVDLGTNEARGAMEQPHGHRIGSPSRISNSISRLGSSTRPTAKKRPTSGKFKRGWGA
jgi:hypothetical protein